MNRVMRSTVVLAAALGAISCKGDPTDSLRNGIDHLVATPSALYIDNGTTQNVVIEAVDDQGNRLSGNFQLTAGSFGPGLGVVADDSFNLVYNDKGVLAPPKNWTRARFKVSALQYVSDSFQVTVGGKSLFIPVRVNPINLSTTLSNTTPIIGEVVTLAAPAGLEFNPATTTVTFTPGGVATITAISPTSVSFIPFPGSGGVASISNVTPLYAPIGPFTLTTLDRITVPAINNLPVTFSKSTTTSFPVQDTVTMTIDPAFRLTPASVVSFGGTAAYVISRAADSLSITVIPIAGSASGPATVSNVIVVALPPTIALTLPTDDPVTIAAASGATSLAGAPTITIPATGNTSFYVDAGQFVAAAQCGNVGVHCRFYKIVLGAPRTFTVSLNWGNTADIGGYFIDAAGNDLFGDFACDSFGSGAGGQPESCSQTLPAGTTYLALADFTAAAQNTTTVRITITGQ